MAKFKITSPDGKQSVMVDGPDDPSQDELHQLATAAFGDTYKNNPIDASGVQKPAADPENSLIADVGSGVAELGRGVAEGAGNVLDHAANWAQSGLNAAGNLVGGGNWGDELNGAGPSIGLGSQNNAAGLVAPTAEGMDTIRGIGRFGGEAVATAPLGAARGGALVQGALGGGLLSDKDTVGGVAADMGMGAIGARVGQGLLGVAAEAAAPTIGNDVRTLTNEGIRTTPGTIAGPGSQVKRLEDIAAKTPGVGGPVEQAQRTSVDDLNRAAANRALRPIGARLPRNVPTGHDSVRYAGDQLSQAYGEVLPRLNGQADNAFARRVRTVVQRADLPDSEQGKVQNVVREALKAFRPHNPATGEDVPITAEQFSQLPPTQWIYNGRRLRDASERLGDLAAGFRRSDNPYDRQVGDVAQQLRDQLHSLARRGNPESAARLRDIDRGYASLVRLEKATAGTAEGIATPAQYDAGVRGMDGSVRRRQSARGLALDQDLSGAARRVMQNNAAQGGSKDVNALGMLAALGAGAMGGAPTALAGIAGIGAGRAAYSPAAQDAIRAIMLRQAGPVGNGTAALLRYGAQAAPVMAPAAIDQLRR